MELKFVKCNHCGNIVAFVKDSGVTPMCCGEEMKEIVANTIDASMEKHIPTYTIDNNIVTVVVGSVNHPMSPEHYIEWVCLKTKMGNQRKVLSPTSEPTVKFALLDGDEVVDVYAYCNLHGLWKK